MKVVLTQRQHVWISYGILIGGLALLLSTLVAPPIVERFAFVSRLNELRSIHARSAETIATGAAATRAWNRRNPSREDRDALFRAETDALAAADLQNRLNTLVNASKGTLVSSAFRRRSETFPLKPVTVAVRLRCSIESLTRILLALENQEPQVFIENLSIRSRHRPGRELRDVAEELDVEFDVTGYLAPPEAEQATSTPVDR